MQESLGLCHKEAWLRPRRGAHGVRRWRRSIPGSILHACRPRRNRVEAADDGPWELASNLRGPSGELFRHNLAQGV